MWQGALSGYAPRVMISPTQVRVLPLSLSLIPKGVNTNAAENPELPYVYGQHMPRVHGLGADPVQGGRKLLLLQTLRTKDERMVANHLTRTASNVPVLRRRLASGQVSAGTANWVVSRFLELKGRNNDEFASKNRNCAVASKEQSHQQGRRPEFV